MIKPEYSIKYTGIAGMKKRDWNNNFLKPAFEAAGRFWHDYILPKHFKTSAYAEYGYQPRGIKYLKAKKAFGRIEPLVWSGELYNKSRKVRIEATSKGVTCYLPDARKANWKRSPKSPDMADEMRRLSDNDRRELVRVINNTLQNLIDGGGFMAVRRFAKPGTQYGPIIRRPKQRTRKPARGRTRSRSTV